MASRRPIPINSKGDYSIKNRKELFLNYYKYKGKERIRVLDENKKPINNLSFEFDENAPELRDISRQKTANEKTISEFFKRKSKEPTLETNRNEFNNDLLKFSIRNKDKTVFKREKPFYNENKIVFTKKPINTNFTYTYLRVTVRVYFNGFYVLATGRSDYVKNRNIKQIELMFYLDQAIKRAIAPYGSNVKFKTVSWDYAYYKQQYIDF